MLLPVLEQLALDLKLNPLLLMVPPVVAVSYAFLLPVSTGVNTIVYTVSGLTTAQFARDAIQCCHEISLYRHKNAQYSRNRI